MSVHYENSSDHEELPEIIGRPLPCYDEPCEVMSQGNGDFVEIGKEEEARISPFTENNITDECCEETAKNEKSTLSSLKDVRVRSSSMTLEDIKEEEKGEIASPVNEEDKEKAQNAWPRPMIANVVITHWPTKTKDNPDTHGMVNRLLAWAKQTSSIQKGLEKLQMQDHRALPSEIIINDLIPSSDEEKERTAQQQSTRFQVESAAEKPFQVRRISVIKPATIITDSWIENVVKVHERRLDGIEIVQTEFRGCAPIYEAYVQAKLIEDDSLLSYEWIIREADIGNKCKDLYVVSDLGNKITKFVGRSYKVGPVPFQPVVYSDTEYIVFENMKSYGTWKDVLGGFDLPHLKNSVKALARLHAMSYAYFRQSKDDVKAFSEVLKLMIDLPYQPSAQANVKENARLEITEEFKKLTSYFKEKDPELVKRADEALEYRLYSIYHDARVSSSCFSVLCHGNPTVDNFSFAYDEERIADVKILNFANARYANGMTDLQILLSTGMPSDMEDQMEFLFRFVYYETLVGTLKGLDVELSVDFDTLKSEFGKQALYGYLYGAFHFIREHFSANASEEADLKTITFLDKAKRLLRKAVLYATK